MTEPASPTGKGRPTPKRSAAQGRRGYVPPPPQTRKEAAQRAKERATEARSRVREGAARGDERYLTKRDAGPVRKLVRDTVDSRRNVGVLVLPLALVLLAAQISRNPIALQIVLALWLSTLLALVVDTVLIAVRIRRAVRAAFPEEGRMVAHVGYGVLRSTVFRRLRMPPPAVSPGR